MRGLTVLGATGTVGRNTLDVVRRNPGRLQVLALTAHSDAESLAALCAEFQPALAVVGDPAKLPQLTQRLRALGVTCETRAGREGLAEAAMLARADIVMCAIVGAAGLLPVLAAVRAGKRVLVANKEPLVMAGGLVMREAARSAAMLIPIDSEHNAVFQCLPGGYRCGAAPPGVRRVTLTASGGPFRELPLQRLADVTPAQAVRHPNWVMGPKISVDSATMMNKGLELIEAHWLFGLPSAQLGTVLHPESVVHSLVEYDDGSTLAQMGQPDMRVPISFALAYPERWHSGVDGLDLAAMARLRFEPVDATRYPCMVLARAALEAGGAAPNVLNAANEVAVQAFLDGRIRFSDIAVTVESCLNSAQREAPGGDEELDSILAVDAWARQRAQAMIAGGSGRTVSHV
jgi:1-deoxy-D-xylulose-5-phosphate reductoisomerase